MTYPATSEIVTLAAHFVAKLLLATMMMSQSLWFCLVIKVGRVEGLALLRGGQVILGSEILVKLPEAGSITVERAAKGVAALFLRTMMLSKSTWCCLVIKVDSVDMALHFHAAFQVN